MADPLNQSGGCSRKLPQSGLLALLGRADLPLEIPTAGPLKSLTDFGDCFRVELDTPASKFLATTDLLFPVSENGRQFGAVTGIHAMSDIYAALGQPLFGCATLGGREDVLGSDFASAVLVGLSEVLNDAGAALAGGHTVVSDHTFLNVAVSGLANSAYDPRPPLLDDRVLISKPLGGGLALTALRMGLVSEADIASEYDAMLTSNRHAAMGLMQALSTDPGSVRTVGDVSGFGLLGALRMISGPCTVEIWSDRVPTTRNAERFLLEQTWSPLTDANLRDSNPYTEYGEGPAVNNATILLNDPQTSGGLVAIVDNRTATRLVTDDGYGFTEIGVVRSVGSKFAVTIAPGSHSE